MICSNLPNSVLRVGLIGAGRIVQRAHLPLLAAHQGVQVAALYDPDLALAKRISGQYVGIEACESREELLARDLDFVLIAGPNNTHAESAIAALEAGSHVLCEKPMAVSHSEARSMQETARCSGRQLMVGFPNRFRPEVQRLEQLIRQGTLGQILSINCGWLRAQGVPGSGTWFTCQRKSGGGVLIDLGSHMLDLACWLGGESRLRQASCVLHQPTTQNVDANWYSPSQPLGHDRKQNDESDNLRQTDVETSAHAFLACGEHLSISLEVSWARAIPEDRTYITIQGEKGQAQLNTLFGFSNAGRRPRHPLKVWTSGQWKAQNVRSSRDLLQPYRSQIEYFVNHLRHEQSLSGQLQKSVDCVHIIDQLYAKATRVVNAPTTFVATTECFTSEQLPINQLS